MANLRTSWSESAATSGFAVRPSLILACGRATLCACWAIAFWLAPGVVLLATTCLSPTLMLRGRSALCPRPLHVNRLQLDVEHGTVTTRDADGGSHVWCLRSWLRHSQLQILYLCCSSRGHACVVLPRDAMDARGRRHLHYLLGVSTVASASGRVSG